MRGIRNLVSQYIFDHGGSPPRMRGILDPNLKEWDLNGITPAHAGNTLKNPMI